MGDRKGHYVRPVIRATAPTSIISLAFESVGGGAVHDDGTVVHSDARVWVASQVRHRTGWGAVRVDQCDGDTDVIALMYDVGSKAKANHVLCPSPFAAFSLCRVWEHFDAHRVTWMAKRSSAKRTFDDADVTVSRMIRSPRCEVIDWRQWGKRWIWVAHMNLLPFDEESIAAQVGFRWDLTPDGEPVTAAGVRSAHEQCRLWLAAGRRLADWWRDHCTAPWGLTSGQLATSVVRSFIKRGDLCTHNHKDAHWLERRAAHGGRAQAFYFGGVGDPGSHDHPEAPAPAPRHERAVPGPLSLVDYRAMYPSLLRDCEFPVRLVGYHYGMSPRDLVDLSKSYSTIADVVVETVRPDYPCRSGQRTLYPVGRFHTTLTGIEIVHLSKHGKIRQVGQVAVYDTGTPFRGAAAHLIRLRDGHRRAGDQVYETFVKLIANSIGGKLAQRKGLWVERRGRVPNQRWGDYYDGVDAGGAARRFRAVAGLCWEYVRDKDGVGPHTAAFAYLSAYGRLAMARLIRSAGERQVVSCDTDGAWVLPEGLDNIKRAGYRFGDLAGQLRVVKRVPAAVFLGPRHYWTPGKWTLSGFHDYTVHPGGSLVTDSRTVVPTAGPDASPPSFVYTTKRTSHLRCEIAGGGVGPDGWWVPRRSDYQMTTSGRRG